MAFDTSATGYRQPDGEAAWRMDRVEYVGLSLRHDDPRLADVSHMAGYRDYRATLSRNEALALVKEREKSEILEHQCQKRAELISLIEALPEATGIVIVDKNEWEFGMN